MKYGMVNKPKEEKDGIKIKRRIDLSLLTTQHEIMTTTLGLLDLSMNHLDTELEMELMIGDCIKCS